MLLFDTITYFKTINNKIIMNFAKHIKHLNI